MIITEVFANISVDKGLSPIWHQAITVGENRGVWTPYPRGSSPLSPPKFFLPAPLFFLFFFRGTPAQNSDFFCPGPSDPRPFFRQKPPDPLSSPT